MKIQKIAIVLTVINLVLMTFLLAQLQPAQAKQSQSQQSIAPVLRGRALEITDSLGKVRASITIEPPVTVDGVLYPQTVLLRLRDSKGDPVIKIDASERGGGLGLSDRAGGGVRLIAHGDGSFVEIKNRGGKQQVIKP